MTFAAAVIGTLRVSRYRFITEQSNNTLAPSVFVFIFIQYMK